MGKQRLLNKTTACTVSIPTVHWANTHYVEGGVESVQKDDDDIYGD